MAGTGASLSRVFVGACLSVISIDITRIGRGSEVWSLVYGEVGDEIRGGACLLTKEHLLYHTSDSGGAGSRGRGREAAAAGERAREGRDGAAERYLGETHREMSKYVSPLRLCAHASISCTACDGSVQGACL